MSCECVKLLMNLTWHTFSVVFLFFLVGTGLGVVAEVVMGSFVIESTLVVGVVTFTRPVSAFLLCGGLPSNGICPKRGIYG